MIKAVLGIVLFLKSIKSQDETFETFVVEGEISDIADFPHSACLAVSQTISTGSESKRVGWVCGASILNQKILLTAAHCVYKCNVYAAYSILVQYGNENKQRAMKMLASKYVIHPEYQENNPVKYDIALVKVEQPFEFNHQVGRVAIMKFPPYNELAWIAGWGFIDEIQRILTSQLKHTNQRVMTREQCQKQLKLNLPQGVICGGDRRAANYIAKGDSGSALVVRGYIQIGIVSCKTPAVTAIAIYTDVGYYYNWIVDISTKLLC